MCVSLFVFALAHRVCPGASLRRASFLRGYNSNIMQVKIIISTLLRNFDMIPERNTLDIKVASDFIMEPYPGLLMNITPL